jgi:hypothetical protein
MKYTSLLLACISLATVACKRNEDVCKLGYKAEFFQDEKVSCGRMIILEDSTVLEPVSGDLGLKIKDGKTFFIEFDTIYSTTTTCNKGIPVHITCISKDDEE